jgi:hypothetical protein
MIASVIEPRKDILGELASSFHKICAMVCESRIRVI